METLALNAQTGEAGKTRAQREADIPGEREREKEKVRRRVESSEKLAGERYDFALFTVRGG